MSQDVRDDDYDDAGDMSSQARQDAFDELRRLVSEEDNLNISTDNRSLSMFLYWTDFDAQLAFEKMKSLYRAKLEHKGWFAHSRDPEVHDAILKRGIHLMLDSRDQKGRQIYLLRAGRMVYGEFEPPEMFQIDDMWVLLAADQEETQRHGLVTIVDFEGMSWRFLRYYTPWYIRAGTCKLENIPLRHHEFHFLNAGIVFNTIVTLVFPFLGQAIKDTNIPFRHHEFHFLNAGIVFNTIVTLVFPFLGQAIKDTVFFHKSLESLHKYVSPSVLPEEYGGERPPVDGERLVREFLDPQQERLAELLSFGYTNSKE